MIDTTLPSPAGWSRVLRTQLRLLRAPRSTGFLALALLAGYVIASLGIVSFELAGAPSVFRGYPLLLVVGAGWAITVWHDTGSPKRDYFWALPVGRSTHALLRTVAGALWLVAGVGLLAALGTVADLLTTHHLSTASILAWLNLFSGPLTLYLLVSAAAIVSAYPGRWAIAVVITWSLLHRICNVGVSCGPTIGGRSVVEELFGLAPAVMDVLRGEFVQGGFSASAAPSLMAIWIALGVAAVMLASRRPPAI